MSIYRIGKRENPYVQIDHRCLDDERLSWKAKGLLAYLLSKPPNWQIVSEDLLKKATDGRESIQSAMRELRDCGYATLEVMTEGTLLRGKKWHIHEEGFSRQTAFPTVGKPATSNKYPDSNKEKTTKKEVVEVLPFESEAFKAAVGMWREHLKQKKVRTTPLAFKLQMAACESVGEARAIAMINKSIMGNYQGLFEPKLSPIQKQAERPAITNDGIWQGHLDSLCREWDQANPDWKYVQNALRRARTHVDCDAIRRYLKALDEGIAWECGPFLKEIE